MKRRIGPSPAHSRHARIVRNETAAGSLLTTSQSIFAFRVRTTALQWRVLIITGSALASCSIAGRSRKHPRLFSWAVAELCRSTRCHTG